MVITERSTYLECISVTLAELLLAGCKRIYAIPRTLLTMADRAKQRRVIAALEDWQLADIGLSRAAVMHEAGKPFSQWKPSEKFAYALHASKIGGVHPEFQFHPDRKWRFDYAWPQAKLAVEIDGFGYGHQAQQSMSADNEKANAAVERGWRVLRYNSRDLGSIEKVKAAVDQVSRVLADAR